MRTAHNTPECVIRVKTAAPCTYATSISASASAHITIPSVLPQIRHKRDVTFLGFQVVVCRCLCEAAQQQKDIFTQIVRQYAVSPFAVNASSI